MSNRPNRPSTPPEKIEKGWQPHVEGGYQPEKGVLGNPPTGGGGGKAPEKKGG